MQKTKLNMGTTYRIKPRDPSSSKRNFHTRFSPSGGKIITINRETYKGAKKAASKKLAEIIYDRQKEPSI
jgi:hypothetical protein